MRDFFRPGRSSATGLTAAVASSHALASGAALRVLTEGGNAVDAAVTATFVLSVVEPQSTGIGGDCFALYFPAGADRPVGFNGSGRTPAGLDPARARAEGGAPLAETSVHSVTIPGMVDGMAQLLSRYGTWPLEQVIEPAIGYAERGFPVHPRVAEEWAFAAGKLARTPGARNVLLRNYEAPAVGDVIRFPQLAATLRRIAGGGRDAFYRGEVAETMARFLADNGGFHSATDFAAHRGAWVEPISTTYNGHDVWQIPPNGQGATALLMLNLLEAFGGDAGEFDGFERHRKLADAARVAFRERNRLVADPEFGPVALEVFLDKSEAGWLAAEARTARADEAKAPRARGDTAYVSVVDKDRNAISLISSLFEGFGSGLRDPDTGVIFHNRGSGFSALADHPNALAPNKRPLHTIIPGMVSQNGRPVLAFGVTGGQYQPIGHAQMITGLVDHGLDIQDVIDRPRSFLVDGRLQLEPALLVQQEALAAAGYDVAPAMRAVGGAHGVWIDWDTGVLSGGSDPRKDGIALAL
ncbi:gamma-glutamyltransferase [Mesorhizobium sp. IMUNJ 23232]|uniref:gamma-glutamyltransferase n=1 Tax=Mesorhizobium sp. IMUNJ 23232 TaxID=3376064 RepID=UPI003789F508